MANLLGTLRRQPSLWMAGVVLAATVLLLLGFVGRNGETAPAELASHTVTRGPFVVTQSFSGRIVPGEQVEILSPSEAAVEDIGFVFGDRVEEGQLLFRLSETDIRHRNIEARISYLQAGAAADKMQQWSTGTEMRNAKRSLEAVQAQHSEAKRRRDEGATLFARGLIPRTEMEGLESSLRQAMQGVQAAQEDLAQTRARGEGVERQVAALQHAVASDRLGEVVGEGGLITAPRAGVMVRPDASGSASKECGAIKVGGKVSRGQSLGVIAVLDGLDAVFRIEESDLSLFQTGMLATVTGPGFAGQSLGGHLLAISGEADAGSSGEKTLFEARVRLDALPADVARNMRIGMTAQVSLVLYETEQAITVPVSALNNGAPLVQVQKTDGTQETRPVTLGRIGADRVEILSGLSVGEKVVWTP